MYSKCQYLCGVLKIGCFYYVSNSGSSPPLAITFKSAETLMNTAFPLFFWILLDTNNFLLAVRDYESSGHLDCR